MMRYKNVFHLLADITKKKNVKIILIGGFAVNHYKYSRHTADVDFLITSDDFDKIKDLLTEHGYKDYIRQNVFINLKNRESTFFHDLDFMFIDDDTFDKIEKKGSKTIIEEFSFRVPSLEDLIALKLHSLKHNQEMREFKDIPDIIQLTKLNMNLISEGQLEELCKVYGPPNIFDKIRKMIWKN